MSTHPNPPEVVTQGEGLRPCPFCGGANVKTFGPYGWYRQYGISHSCKSFYSGTSEMMQGFPREQEAIAAWNSRHRLRHTPDREAMARVLYEALNSSPTCYRWDDCGLDDEHPGARLRYYRQADAIIAMIEGGGA